MLHLLMTLCEMKPALRAVWQRGLDSRLCEPVSPCPASSVSWLKIPSPVDIFLPVILYTSIIPALCCPILWGMAASS